MKKILELPLEDDVSIEPKEIIESCTRVISDRESHNPVLVGKALIKRSLAYAKMFKLESAIKDLDDYLSIQPESAEVLCHRSSAYFASQQREKAHSDIERALKLDPKYVEAHLGKAALLIANGQEKLALAAVEKAISINPKHPQSFFLRGFILCEFSPEECIRSMNRFIELSPNDSMYRDAPYFYRGYCLALLNRTEEALSNFLMARKLNPSSLQAAGHLAITYGTLGRLNLASHYGEVCVRMDPKASIGYFLCSKYYHGLGKASDALRAAEKYFELKNDDPRADYNVGELCSVLGKPAQALVYFNKALIADPGDYYARIGKASLLATSADPKIRDGAQAVKLAIQAFEDKKVREFQRWSAAIALAEAHAEAGDFRQAVRYAQMSVELAGPDFGRRGELLQKLTLFESNLPYRRKAIATP